MKKIVVSESDVQKRDREMVDEIARNIERLSQTVRSIITGRMKEGSIVTLLVHTTKLPRYNIEKVLEALKNMERDHLK